MPFLSNYLKNTTQTKELFLHSQTTHTGITKQTCHSLTSRLRPNYGLNCTDKKLLNFMKNYIKSAINKHNLTLRIQK